jgi:hypoxanthine phosphoribosyltransferase
LNAKTYISAQQLLDDSYELALKVLASDFVPTMVVGIWRGGTPIAIAMQELMAYLNVTTHHIAIKTASYTNVAQRGSSISVDALDYVFDHCTADDRILLVDDVYDSGLSLARVIEEMEKGCANGLPDIRIATPYFKPLNNQTSRAPDFFLYEASDWLVFPHELVGLQADEILSNKPGIDRIRKTLEKIASSKLPS